nr:uncharacterized protein K02A2.6-like [Vanessa tameamea]
MAQLTLEKFDCEGETTSVGVRWERWKRALSIYLNAAGIDDNEKKKASLLHFGGLELQEIFYNIPGTSTTDNGDVFQAAINKLDNYFAPKQSKVYERHLFRLISQDTNEKFEKFLVRLRQQADKCQFNDKEDQIIDQITEKCSSKELRKKILQTGDSITLTTIIAEANALEAVNRQLQDFASGTDKSVDVNKVDLKARNKEKFKTRIDNQSCGRCGGKSHNSQDSKCPARNKDCLKCGLIGHFRQIDEDSELECKVGGIKIKMLVDSGCKCNLITSKTLQTLKAKSAKMENMIKNPNKKFFGIPIPLEEKVNKKIEELIDRDIIEEVHGSSKWVSPIVPVLKESGDIRLCVDMRRANTAILRENHPLPTMDKLLPKIKDAKFFSKLDIKDAFHQLELHPDSRHITTFITGKGLYRYKRLMFGISCAPEIFQKILERILLGCEGTINFIDDILVYGKDLKEHDRRLVKVKEVLEENNVVLSNDKCLYRQNKIQFLGHELSGKGVKPLQKYVSSIQGFRAPINIGELQSFLGLINFVGKWIPNLATKAEPLKELLRNNQGKAAEIGKSWRTKQETAFNELKLALSNIPTLGYYDVKDRTLVIADASPVALGSVLVQTDERGPRIIAYGHKTLTDCERRYCQTEKEALALVWAVEHFHVFLYGKYFELVTDHKPLEVIFGPKSKPCARIERWVLRLQTYDFKVVYKPGKENIADSLSRLCHLEKPFVNAVEDDIHQIVKISRPTAVSLQDIIKYSEMDQEILKVKEGIYNNAWDDIVKNYSLFKEELCFYEGLLLRGTRIVIPTQLRKQVLAAAHEGHPGIVLMKARLRTKVWWPRYDKDAETLVKTCKGCTLVSAPNPPNPLKRRELPNEPWVDIAIDLMGPLPNGDFILVVVDYFSRYKEINITRKISSLDVIQILKQIFSRLGNPATITADNGRQFCSQEFKQFCKDRNITLFNSVPYWPQQNGEVERQNRDILKRLKISQVEKSNLKEALEEYLTMYNSTPHSVTGRPPAELFFKRQFRDKIPMISDLSRRLEDSEIRDMDKQKKQLGKEYADENRKAKECDLVPGDKVYLKNLHRDSKLSLNYNPVPHTVEKSIGGDIEVRNDLTGQISRRNVIHLKRIEGHWRVLNDKEKELEHAEETNNGNKEDN